MSEIGRLIDRDGRVIGCNLPIGNGPLLKHALAMAQILRSATSCADGNSVAGMGRLQQPSGR